MPNFTASGTPTMYNFSAPQGYYSQPGGTTGASGLSLNNGNSPMGKVSGSSGYYSTPNGIAGGGVKMPGMASTGSGLPSGEGVLSGPGYGEDWYKTQGSDLSGPSNSQTLFNEGMAGTDPYYNYAQQQVDRGINDAASARGNFDSSSTMNTLALANADLRGQQAMGMAGLAGQADTQAATRYTATGNQATQAQNDLENRVVTDVNGTEKLSQDQANLVQGFYDLAQKGELTADMAAIEAQMQAAGMDAAEIQAEMNMLFTGGGVATKAYSAVAGSGSGAGTAAAAA